MKMTAWLVVRHCISEFSLMVRVTTLIGIGGRERKAMWHGFMPLFQSINITKRFTLLELARLLSSRLVISVLAYRRPQELRQVGRERGELTGLCFGFTIFCMRMFTVRR